MCCAAPAAPCCCSMHSVPVHLAQYAIFLASSTPCNDQRFWNACYASCHKVLHPVASRVRVQCGTSAQLQGSACYVWGVSIARSCFKRCPTRPASATRASACDCSKFLEAQRWRNASQQRSIKSAAQTCQKACRARCASAPAVLLFASSAQAAEHGNRRTKLLVRFGRTLLWYSACGLTDMPPLPPLQALQVHA